MPERPHLCVFCGSQRGVRPAYVEAAEHVGETLAARGIGLVYGGGRVGLMGAMADAALRSGGRVVGVIPKPLAIREIAHHGLTELHVVSGMHERKALMASLSAGFLTLPGGAGTLEEFFEIFTWALLGLHRKPVGLLNVDHYYDPILSLLDHAVTEGFLRGEHRDLVFVSDDPEAIAATLLSHEPPPPGPKWIELDET